MIQNRTFTLERGGVRVDAALLDLVPTSTRAFVRDALARGDILIDGKKTLKGAKTHDGGKVEIRELLEAADNLVRPEGDPPEPVYADKSILAFDKPAGQPVQPLSCRETGTLANAVAHRYPECRPLGDRPLLAGAVHRIDADTSGLVLFARTAAAFAELRGQFAAQTVEKTYLALVEGAVKAGGTLEHDLIHDPTLPFCRMIDFHHNRLTTAVLRNLKPLHATTRFEPIGQTKVESEDLTLLKVTIFTGVTHQIRAQLALSGLHIVNDRLYGAFAVENRVGHCLHALKARFRHPAGGEEIVLETPVPPWAKDGITPITS